MSDGANVHYPEHSALLRTPRLRHSLMRLTLALLGFELDLTFGPETTASDANALDGGTTVSERVEAGETDVHLGFTNGREGDGE